MHNKNFINECIDGREKLVKTKEFKKFQRDYIFKMFLYNTVAFIVLLGLFLVLNYSVSSEGGFWLYLSLGIFFSMLIPLYNLPKFLLLLVGIKKVSTEEWLEHIGEDEKRAWYEISKIYNTNLFDLDELSELEYKKLRLVFDDDLKSYIYSPSGVLLTDEPIINVEITDKSYNDINTTIGNRVETKRIKKIYTKVVFADGKFITFLNISDEFSRKFEQLML